MTGVDIKGLIQSCGGTLTRMLSTAAGLTLQRSHYEVTVEHLLLTCLDEAGCDVPVLLEAAGIDQDQLRRELNRTLDSFRTGNSGRPVLAPSLQDLMEAGWLVSGIDLKSARIRTGGILLAFLRRPGIYAQGRWTDIIERADRDLMLRDFARITKGSIENRDAAPSKGTGSAAGGAPVAASGEGGSCLERFCEDFTAKARDGRIDPVFGRDKEIRQMIDILARRRKNNPILVGHPGTGKTAVLEGLALRIVQGDVPDTIAGVRLLSLDMGLLEAGASVKGEFERRLRGVLDEIKASETPIILFIDEAHMLVGAGGAQGGGDAANLMKPALARGEIRTCAATTWKEYKKYFEKDPALARRFQLVKLDEPSVEDALLILRGIAPSYEKCHSVVVRDDALAACATLSGRYIQGRYQPDKSIDLLDTACARVRVAAKATPAALEDLRHGAQALEREKNALVRDQDAGGAIDEAHLKELDERISSMTAEAADLEARWTAERDAADAMVAARTVMQQARTAFREQATPETEQAFTEAKAAYEETEKALLAARGEEILVPVEVTADVVAAVVSDWTGIPVGRMARDQAAVAASLFETLEKRIKGQDAALRTLCEGIQAAKAGLRAPEQPQGVFLLVGPSGVGKTETGLAIAESLFGDERNVVSVNMSEFQEKHTVSRLIGSPPGYVGYGEGGMLTEAVRRKPYSVVLLDECEKAHPDVMQLFYQVFDKGILTDGEGTDVSFKNTIILLTSNLGSDITTAMCSGDEMPGEQEVADALRPVLSQHFQPALLARMKVVPYVSLPESTLARIAVLRLEILRKRLQQNGAMGLAWDDTVPAAIAARCTDTDTGARNIEAVIQGTIVPELSKRILARMAEDADKAATDKKPEVTVHLGIAEDNSFSITFETGEAE